MNLHGLVAGGIGTVNPFVPGTIRISIGSTTEASGKRTPQYRTFNRIMMQVQALSGRDLRQLDGVNLNGTLRKIYIQGQLDGVTRVSKRGGDLITLSSGPDAGVWLVNQVLEQWPDWCAVAATLQNDPSPT